MRLAAWIALSTLTLCPLAQKPATTNEAVEDVAVLEKLLRDALETSEPAASAQDTLSFRGYLSNTPENTQDSLFLGAFPTLSSKFQRSSVHHSRAFHVPGAGVFIAIDLELPSLPVSTDPEAPQAPQDQPDDWDRAQRELRGKTASAPPEMRDLSLAIAAYKQLKCSIDEGALARARDAVLDVLARYGRRVRGLAPDETVTVALHVSAAAGRLQPLALDQMVIMRSDAEQQGDRDAAARWNQWLSGRAAGSAPPVHLIVRARAADLATSAPAADPLENLRARAQIYRY